MKQSKVVYIDNNKNEWVVERKHEPFQEWNFYWVAECKALNMQFKGKVKKYVIKKIKEYEAS